MSRHHSTLRLVVMAAVGIVAAVIFGMVGRWEYAPTIGWIAAALTYSVWVWVAVGQFDAETTRTHASIEEPARGIVDALIVALSLASLASVAFLLVRASAATGGDRVLLAGVALGSVALSWVLLHTLFTLRYARDYYQGDSEGGVEFTQNEPPAYSDFAYLSFTLGMTYQVSDTGITSHRMRMSALQHALLSFVFGSVILATTINLVAGLSG